MGKKLDYGESEDGNFKVVDTMGVPHGFCLTPRHISWAANKYGGMLTRQAVAESGAPCGIKGCTLTVWEHKTALLVSCLQPVAYPETKENNKEVEKYLRSIVDQCIKEDYSGFVFLDSKDSGKHPPKRE